MTTKKLVVSVNNRMLFILGDIGAFNEFKRDVITLIYGIDSPELVALNDWLDGRKPFSMDMKCCTFCCLKKGAKWSRKQSYENFLFMEENKLCISNGSQEIAKLYFLLKDALEEAGTTPTNEEDEAVKIDFEVVFSIDECEM